MERKITEHDGKKYRVLDGSSSDSLYFFDRGIVKLKEDKYEDAYIDFTQAININPSFGMAYVNRAIAYKYLDKIQESFNDLAKALELDPINTQALYNRGYMFGQQSKFEESKSHMDAILKIEPQSGKALYVRGMAKINMKDNEGACKDWKRAIELGYEDIDGVIEKHCNS